MAGIRATYDMFAGSNGEAMLQVFRMYCPEGVILSDIEMLRLPDTGSTQNKSVLIIGYGKASQSVTVQQGDPTQRGPQHDRVHEVPRKELRMVVDGAYLDTDLLIAKLALLRG